MLVSKSLRKSLLTTEWKNKNCFFVTPNQKHNNISFVKITSMTNCRGSWVVGRGWKSWVVGVGVGKSRGY